MTHGTYRGRPIQAQGPRRGVLKQSVSFAAIGDWLRTLFLPGHRALGSRLMPRS
jgi:hypothetical protein